MQILSEEYEKLSKKVLKGDRLAIARAMTHIENEEKGYVQFLTSLFYFTGGA